MSHEQFASPHGAPVDIESIRQFWDAVLRRIKAYAESNEAARPPTIDASRDSDTLTDTDDGSCEGERG